MKIVIIGAGQVGSTLAENLANEANDVSLVDTDGELLAELRDRLDIRTVTGEGSHPRVLEQAGIVDADMLIAVTAVDEVNILACQIAHSIFHTPRRIARIRSQAYTDPAYATSLFRNDNLAIDDIFTPEQLVTDHLQRLVEQSGALQVLDFAQGEVQLVGVRATPQAHMVGEKISALREHMPKIDLRVAAIYRRGKAIIPSGETVIEQDDEVFFLAASRHLRSVMAELAGQVKPYRNVVIAGGGNIGFRLASALQDRFRVKVIELSKERCEVLATQLNCIVLEGSSSDQEMLLEEGIDSTDVFLAVTNNDAANIMSSMLAKRLGAGKVITLINSPVYVDLMQGSVIDIAISPEQITTSSLLAYVRKGDTIKVYSLRRGAAEAMELVAHGDRRTSRVVGRTISEIQLPPGATIGALVRFGERKPQVLMAHHDTIVEDGDHVIIFLVDRNQTSLVVQLFEPNRFFFQ